MAKKYRVFAIYNGQPHGGPINAVVDRPGCPSVELMEAKGARARISTQRDRKVQRSGWSSTIAIGEKSAP